MRSSCLVDSDINLRYADDATLLAETEDDLKHLIITIPKMECKLNIKKTKTMSTARHGRINVTINGEDI